MKSRDSASSRWTWHLKLIANLHSITALAWMVDKQHSTPSWCSKGTQRNGWGCSAEHQGEKWHHKLLQCIFHPEGLNDWKKRAFGLSEQYLDGGVQRRLVLLFEAGSDVQHVHFTPRHHYPHQGVVISSSTLNTDTDSAAVLINLISDPELHFFFTRNDPTRFHTLCCYWSLNPQKCTVRPCMCNILKHFKCRPTSEVNEKLLLHIKHVDFQSLCRSEGL